MPRPTDASLDAQETTILNQLEDARRRTNTSAPDDQDVRRAAIVAHFAAALASLRSIQRGAK